MAIITIKDKDGNLIDIPALQGKTAYQYAKEQGFTGTEDEFGNILANNVADIQINDVSVMNDNNNVLLNPQSFSKANNGQLVLTRY
jgi:hypothetical protein